MNNNQLCNILLEVEQGTGGNKADLVSRTLENTGGAPTLSGRKISTRRKRGMGRKPVERPSSSLDNVFAYANEEGNFVTVADVRILSIEQVNGLGLPLRHLLAVQSSIRPDVTRDLRAVFIQKQQLEQLGDDGTVGDAESEQLH